MAHVRVMFAEEEQAIAGRAPDSYVSLAANHKGKPGETSRRKAMGSKAAPAMTARLLIMISKPPEMTGRKAMGANVLSTMPARPPDTLHPTICKERKINMRKTLKKCLARLLALTVVASMTCSYVFAASFDDLQAAIDGSDKPEVSAPADSLPADKTPEPDPEPDGGSDDSSVPSEPSTPGESDQSGSTDGADSGDSSNTDNSGETAGTPTEGSETSDGTQGTEGGEVNNDNTTSEDGNGEGTEPTEPEDTEPPADTEPPVEPSETPADTESNEGNGENPAGGQPAEGDQTVKAPEEPVKTPEEPKKPENGSVVGNIDGNTQYGYGWTQDEDGKWTYSIVTWDVKGDNDVTDRYIQLRDDVTHSSSDKAGSITIGNTPSGGKIILDLFGHSVTGNGKDNVVKVDSGNLTLNDSKGGGTITGGTTGVYLQNGSSFTMEGGTISGNTTGSNGGGVYVGKDSTFNMKDGEISGNTVKDYMYKDKHYEADGGGVLVEGGTFNMSGGTITNNSAIGGNGGGVAVKDYYDSGKFAGHSTFNMTGGTISNNHADTGNPNSQNEPIGQGGGVYVGHGAGFNLNGGTISGNTADEGGGIFTEGADSPRYYDGKVQDWSIKLPNGTFNMSDGTVLGNTANIGEGGGIYIQGKGTITAGHILNNVTLTERDLGGGGIYIENGGELKLYNAIITDNKADGLGGGLAACVHGKTVVYVKNGAAIWENTANGEAASKGYNGNGTKIDGNDLWKDNQGFKDGAQDIFTASDAKQTDWSTNEYGKPGVVIGPQMLGGGDANWVGWKFIYDEKGNLETVNGKVACVQVTKDEDGNLVYADRLLGVTAEPDAETIEAAKAAARAATGGVWIEGNYSKTHGGGIANNGLLIIGEDVFEYDDPDDPEGTKTLTKDENAPAATPDRDLKDGEFKFVLTDKAGNPIYTGTNNADGDIVIKFPEGYFLDKETGDHEFYITEVNDGAENIIYDGTKYKVVVTVSKDDIEDKFEIGKGEPITGTRVTAKMVIYKVTYDKNGDEVLSELGDDKMTFNNKYTSTPVRDEPGGDDDDDDDDEPDNPPPENPPEDPTVDVPEPEVPLANLPEEPEIEIPEEEVPLAESPQTGDGSHTALWAALSGFSLLGMLAMVLGKKRDEL